MVKVTSVRVEVYRWRIVPVGLEIEPPVTPTGPLKSAKKSVPLPTVRSTPPVFVSVYPLVALPVDRSRRFDPAVASIVPLLTIVPAAKWMLMRRSPLLPPDEIVPALLKTELAGVAELTVMVLEVVSAAVRVSVNPEAIVRPEIAGLVFSTTGLEPLSDPLIDATSVLVSGTPPAQLPAVFQTALAAPCHVLVVTCPCAGLIASRNAAKARVESQPTRAAELVNRRFKKFVIMILTCQAEEPHSPTTICTRLCLLPR